MEEPDSVAGSMLPNLKKDKICLVCGDKALGYNFNAVSCESCKAFFRRNAHKTIRGRCEGKCDVNIESRSFCKRCRLAKCFTVGMRKDMILDDDQKKVRKQKILINKLRRRGSFPPEDTYAVSENDLKHSYNQKVVKASRVSLKKQFPKLSEEEISRLQNMKTDDPTAVKVKTETSRETVEYEPWNDVKDELQDILARMDDQDRHVLLEMNSAHENSSFLSNTQTQLKSLPTTPTEMFNIADGFVRRIIKVVKQLGFFQRLCKEDQIAMLKGSVVEIMILRSAVNFDVKTETWTLNTRQCINPTPTPGPSSAPDTPTFMTPTPTAAESCSSATNTPAGLPSARNMNIPAGVPLNPAGIPSGIPAGYNGSTAGMDIEELRKAAASGADINALRDLAKNRAEVGSNPGLNIEELRKAAASGADINALCDSTRNRADGNSNAGLNIEELRKAAASGADINALRDMARNRGDAGSNPGLNIEELRKAAAGGADMNALRDLAKNRGDASSNAGLNIEELRKAAAGGADMNALRDLAKNRGVASSNAGLNIEELRNAAANGADMNALRDLARQRAMAGSNAGVVTDTFHSPDRPIDMSDAGALNINELRKAAMSGANMNTLREMAKQQGNNNENVMNPQHRMNMESVSGMTRPPVDQNMTVGAENIDQVRNAAQSAGLDINALRNAAMSGASFEELSRMARGEKVEIKGQSEGGESSSNISAEILKMGNTETRTMFLTYSKFIRSLMKTIHGDTVVLKLMIMLALFSSDRPDIKNRDVVERYQETYAHVLQSYIQQKFPDNKNMFAQCIMKLTDLRNVNEVHTKMLLKLQVQDIEPLLIEIFDLPT